MAKAERKLDLNKIQKRTTKTISSEDALKDIKPIQWSNDVLSGKKKATISQGGSHVQSR